MTPQEQTAKFLERLQWLLVHGGAVVKFEGDNYVVTALTLHDEIIRLEEREKMHARMQIGATMCVRHPERTVTSADPEARKWLTMKRWSREKNDFVIDHYCPECRTKFEGGKLV